MMAPMQDVRPELRPWSNIKGGKTESNTHWSRAELPSHEATTLHWLHPDSDPLNKFETKTGVDRGQRTPKDHWACVFRKGNVAIDPDDCSFSDAKYLFWAWFIREGTSLLQCPLKDCKVEITRSNRYSHIFFCPRLHTGSYRCPSCGIIEKFATPRGRTREALDALQQVFKYLCKLGRIDSAFRYILPKLADNQFRKHGTKMCVNPGEQISPISRDELPAHESHRELSGWGCGGKDPVFISESDEDTVLTELPGAWSPPEICPPSRPGSKLLGIPEDSTLIFEPDSVGTSIQHSPDLKDGLNCSDTKYQLTTPIHPKLPLCKISDDTTTDHLNDISNTQNSSPVSTSSDETLVEAYEPPGFTDFLISTKNSLNNIVVTSFQCNDSKSCLSGSTANTTPSFLTSKLQYDNVHEITSLMSLTSTKLSLSDDDEASLIANLKAISQAFVDPLNRPQEISRLGLLKKLELSECSSLDIFIEGVHEYFMWCNGQIPQTARQRFCVLHASLVSAFLWNNPSQVDWEYNICNEIMERIPNWANSLEDLYQRELFAAAIEAFFFPKSQYGPHVEAPNCPYDPMIDIHTFHDLNVYHAKSSEPICPILCYIRNFLELFQFIHVKDPRGQFLFQPCKLSYFIKYYDRSNEVLKDLVNNDRFVVFRPLIQDAFDLGKIECFCQLQLNLIMEGRYEVRDNANSQGALAETYIAFSEEVRWLCRNKVDGHADHRNECLLLAAKGIYCRLEEALVAHKYSTSLSCSEYFASPTSSEFTLQYSDIPELSPTLDFEIPTSDMGTSMIQEIFEKRESYWFTESEQLPVTSEMEASSRDSEFRCQFCGRCFRGKAKNARANRKRHVEEKHNKKHKKSYCPICKKPFNRQSNMAQHIKERHEARIEKNIKTRKKVAKEVKRERGDIW